jgi:hypothetical protein
MTDPNADKEPAKSPTDFFEFAVEASQAEYADILDNWKWIDSKAQATSTICGVFLAASFAFLKNSQFNLDTWEKVLLVVLFVALISAIGFAVLAMHVRETSARPMGAAESHRRATDATDRPASEHDVRYLELIKVNAESWVEANEGFRKGVSEKAAHLRLSQGFLLGAVTAVTALLLATILRM